MRNDGSNSEALFVEKWEKFSQAHPKDLFIHRVTDTKSIKSVAGQRSFAKAAPSDFILTWCGQMEYAEVKSTSEATSWSLSCFTPSQNTAMMKQIAAGGHYNVYVHHLPTDSWYKISAHIVKMWREAKLKSIKWKDLEQLKWKL